MTDWKNMLPEPPPPPTVPSEPAPIEPEPPIDNDSIEYWQRPASPAEVARAEAYERALERAEERRSRSVHRHR
jgi:hypothetical protein